MMRKITFIICIFLFGFSGYGQKKHSAGHTQRAAEKHKSFVSTEKNIERFIQDNTRKYKLTAAKIAEVKRLLRAEDKDFDFNRNIAYFRLILENVKRVELAKLYFSKNPDAVKTSNTMARPADVTERFACDSGDFEDEGGLTDDYDFERRFYGSQDSIPCNFAFDSNGFISYGPSLTAVNLDTSNVHVTRTEMDSLNPTFDALLFGINDSIQIPIAHHGNHALKLNNRFIQRSDDDYIAAKMIKTFTASSNNVTFSYSFICQNPDSLTSGHHRWEQPRFIARLYDKNRNVLDQFCLVADVNDTAHFRNATPENINDPLLYTGWQCMRLDIPSEIQNAISVADREVSLEISVNDCTLTGHYGYAYIDDICIDGCDRPSFGLMDLDIIGETVGDCPESVTVSGTFSPPTTNFPHTPLIPADTGVLQSMTLNIWHEGSIYDSFAVDIVNDVDYVHNGFSVDLLKSDFGPFPTGSFTFEVIANFDLDGVPYSISDVSDPGDGITFNTCTDCPVTLTLYSTTHDVPVNTQDHRQAHYQISASNLVRTTNNVAVNTVYRAGTEVLLTDGFTAVKNAVFRAHIEDCATSSYVVRAVDPIKNTDRKNYAYGGEIALEKINSSSSNLLTIYPNPASSAINLMTDNGSLNEVTIASIEGKVVFSKRFGREESQAEIDISSLAKGVYIINVTTDTGETYAQKLLKN